MNIKKIRPTPRSITHKKPTKMSASSLSSKIPKLIKRSPAKYHKVRILIDVLKKNTITNNKICNKTISLNNSAH